MNKVDSTKLIHIKRTLIKKVSAEALPNSTDYYNESPAANSVSDSSKSDDAAFAEDPE